MRWALSALYVTALLATAPLASAQDAGCPSAPDVGPLEVVPAVGATLVPRNAVIRVRYSPGYFAGATAPTETITLTRAGGAAVAGTVQLAGDETLYFVPTSPLDASTVYTGTASGSAFLFDFSFTTGTTTDVAWPVLDDPHGADGFSMQSSPADLACAPSGSRRIDLRFPSALDDGPSSSLEYQVYLARGEGLSAPTLLTRVRDYGASITTVGFVLGPDQVKGAVCISVVAVDGLDRSTEWPSPVCFDPVHGSGFVGLCSASPGAGSRSAGLAWLVVGGVLLLRRRRVLSR